MSKRLKLSKTPALQTRADVDDALSQFRELTLRIDRINHDREVAIKQIDDRCAVPLEELESGRKAISEQLKDWSLRNAEEFGERKSLATIHGTFGWRIGNFKHKLLRGWTLESVLSACKDILPECVRTREEPDFARIIAQREIIGPDKLGLCGVKVVQDETFFVEPKMEVVQP